MGDDPNKRSKADIEKDFAWVINEENKLPKGLVTRLLSENKVSQDIIDKVTNTLVPYGHT